MNILKFVKAHSATILLTVGCIGVVGTAVAAVFGKDNYDRIITDTKNKKEEKKEPLKKTDVVKAAGKAYWLTAVIAVGSICCLVASNKINSNTITATTAALALKTTDYKKLADSAREKLGEKKFDEMQEKIVSDKIENNQPTVIISGVGDQLCYDAYHGRYFIGDIATIKDGVHDAVNELRNNGSLSENEFWNFLSPNIEEIDCGDIYGWDCSYEGTKDDIRVRYYSKVITEGPYKNKVAFCIAYECGYEPNYNLNFTR